MELKYRDMELKIALGFFLTRAKKYEQIMNFFSQNVRGGQDNTQKNHKLNFIKYPPENQHSNLKKLSFNPLKLN